MRAAALAPSSRSLAASTSSRRAASVVVAAKPTKAADFRGLSNDEIDAAVAESKRALFDMRIAQRTRQVRPSFFIDFDRAFVLLHAAVVSFREKRKDDTKKKRSRNVEIFDG